MTFERSGNKRKVLHYDSELEHVYEDSEASIPIPVMRPWVYYVILFSVGVACFINSYDGQFVFDDSEAILTNKDLLPEVPVENLLHHDFWGSKLSNTSHKSYRPLTVLTFRWNYWWAGGHHPMGFHVVNIVLHGLISALLLPVFSLLVCTSTSASGMIKLPFLCSLLFAVHPVHTENVAGIVGRADLLCAIFFICSFLFYVKGATSDKPWRPERFSLSWLLASQVMCGLATFSKEQGITVIGVCSAYDILCVCGIDFGSVFGLCPHTSSQSSPSHSQRTSNGTTSKKNEPHWQLSVMKRHVVLVSSAILLLITRWRVMGSAPPTFQVHDNPHSFVEGVFYRVLNYSYLYSINAWLLLSAHWLCFDWSMGCVPTITSFSDPRLLAVAALWAGLALLVWACLCAPILRQRRTVTLALAIASITFLPASNLLFRVGFVVAERILYLPSIGFCLLVGKGVERMCQNPRLKSVAVTGFALLLFVFAARSIQRSSQWRSEMELFSAGEKICPNNAKVHYNLGKLTADAGNAEGAIWRYRHAIKLNPAYDQAMNNLANILKDKGEVHDAEVLLDKAVSLSHNFAAAWMNRGIVKAALEKYDESEKSYKEALRCRKNYPDCYYNLGNLYLEMGRHQECLTAYYNATLLKPTHWNAWNNAIILLDKLEQYDKAEKLGVTALKNLPNDPRLLHSLANVYGKQEKFVESEKLFLAAVQTGQATPGIYLNLGVLYHRWARYPEAEKYYMQALKLDPHNQVTKENLAMLKTKVDKTGK